MEGVTVRETLLRGPDGRRFYIPNAKVMTGIIDVGTDGAALRQSITTSVDLGSELEAVRTTLIEALERSAGVLPSPPPDVVLTDIADGTVTFVARFWTGSHRRASTAARDAVIRSLADALVAGGIATPVDHLRVTLADDQTGPTDPTS